MTEAEDERLEARTSGQPLRSAKSQPDVAAASISASAFPPLLCRGGRARRGSLQNVSLIPRQRSSASVGSEAVGHTFHVPPSGAARQRSSASVSVSEDSRNDVPVADKDDADEDAGGHDTITSLAGARVLQKYRRAISLGARTPASANAQQKRLEDLFREGTLEDIRESEKETIAIEEEDLEEESLSSQAPDGGYGWFVVLGTFIAVFWCSGLTKSYGILFNEILRTFPDATVSSASWIPAIMVSVGLGISPVTSVMCRKYGCRAVTFAGSLFCTVGICLSSVVPSFLYLFFTFGVLTGIGIGLSTTPGIFLIAKYFDRNRAKANAICLSGTAGGIFTLPHLIKWLLYLYGFRGTLVVLGACMLHICISAALLRPIELHLKILLAQSAKCETKPTDANGNAQQSEEKALLVDPPPAFSCTCSSRAISIPSVSAHQVSHLRHISYPASAFASAHSTDPRDIGARLSARLRSLERHQREQESHVQTGDDASVHSSRGSVASRSRRGSLRAATSNEYYSNAPTFEYSVSRYSGSSNASVASSGSASPMVARAASPLRELQFSASYRPLLDPGLTHSCCSHMNRPALLNAPETVQHSKTLSLRELYWHQLGSRLNLYATRLLGGGADARKPSSVSMTASRRSFGVDKSAESLKSRTSRKAGGHRVRKHSSLVFSVGDLTTDPTSVLEEPRRRRPSRQIGSSETAAVDAWSRRTSSAGSAVSRKATLSRLLPGDRHFVDDRPSSSRFRLVTPGPDGEKDIEDIKEEEEPTAETVSSPAEESTTQDKRIETDQVEAENEAKEDICEASKEHCVIRFVRRVFFVHLDIHLVKDPLFLMMAGAVICMSAGLPHVLFFLPSHASQMDVDIAVLLGAYSVADLVGRLSSGVIIDLRLVPSHIYFALANFVSGAAVLVIACSQDVLSMAAAMVFFGVATGTYYLMVPLLLSEYLGVERIAPSYGLVRFFQSITNLMGPIVGGNLWQATGSLVPTFTYMGIVMCLGSICILLKPLADRKSETKAKECRDETA